MLMFPQKSLLAVLACGTAFAGFSAIADQPDQKPAQAIFPNIAPSAAAPAAPANPAQASGPILLAQAATTTTATPTPPQIGAVGGGNATGAGVAPEHADWKLVWEDDFSKDNGKIDPKKWSFKIDGGGNGNHESEYYTDDPKNAQIEDGALVLTVLKEDMKWAHYTSAKLWTKGLYSVKYGRIEACIKAPAGQLGNWPAFWMMPDEPSPYGGWPACGEIDIMEMVNDAKTLYGTMHYGKTWKDKDGGKIQAPNGDFSTDYHVYAVEWEANEIRTYVDGKPYGKVNKWFTPGHPYPAPFDQKFYIILNFAVGGDWPNNIVTPKRNLPDPDGKFPQSMAVKWVRVYQPDSK